MDYIHVNQGALRSNSKRLKDGTATSIEELEPVVTSKSSRHKTGVYGQRIAILDANGNEVAEVVYDPFHPLGCGAKAWVQAKYGTKVKE